MPRRTSYKQGTPCWVDLQTTDQEGAKAFYGQLLGWRYDDQPMPPMGTYSLATKNGDSAAAITAQSPDMVAQGAPPMWNTYIAVDNVDEIAQSVGKSGGKLAMEPFDVTGAGRMAFAIDPSGAAIGFWQAKEHIGATIVNEPGSFIWNELITDDRGAALPFYEAVLGVTVNNTDMDGAPYSTIQVDGESIAGSMAPVREHIPNHWHVYFAVDDVAAAGELATKLGGEVVSGPRETSFGPMSTMKDPQGAYFSLFSASS